MLDWNTGDPGSILGPATRLLAYPQQVTAPICASISPSVKWEWRHWPPVKSCLGSMDVKRYTDVILPMRRWDNFPFAIRWVKNDSSVYTLHINRCLTFTLFKGLYILCSRFGISLSHYGYNQEQHVAFSPYLFLLWCTMPSLAWCLTCIY